MIRFRKMSGLLVVASALGIAYAAPGFAQSAGVDYVFSVPVRIESAPPLAGHPAGVECTVSSLSSGRYITAGEGRATFDVGSGGYRGTVRVEVTLLPGVSRADSVRWDCALEFFSVTDASGHSVSWGTPNSVEAVRGYPAITGQTITSTVLSTAGDIPH